MMIFLETKSEDNLKLGDLIELSRLKGLYAHWAVYVGDGDVIHLSPPPSKSKSPAAKELCSAIATSSGVTTIIGETIDMELFGSIKVRRDKLKDVAGDSAIVVNNECDGEMTPFPGEVIVKRAESKLGTNDYNPLTWNCEHFATWCRYGKAVSKQVPFIQGLSKDAYLVQLAGTEGIPPGTLPEDIFVRGNRAFRHAFAIGRVEANPQERLAENIAAVGHAFAIGHVEANPQERLVENIAAIGNGLGRVVGIPPNNQDTCAIM